jgi:hypothetical protein
MCKPWADGRKNLNAVAVKKPRPLILVTALAGVIAPLVLGAAVWQFWGGLPLLGSYEYSCSRSGQRALKAGAELVRAQVPRSSDFELQTYDCDSGSSASMQFSSGLAPAELRQALLADPRCRFWRDDPASTTVTCKIRWHTVEVAIDGLRGGSRGKMTLP